MTIAAAAHFGWWAEMPLLSSWGSGFAAMKPSTALCLAALGLALVHPGKNSRFASAIGLAVVAVAAFDLSQDLFGIDFGFNRWLAPRTTVPGPGSTSLQVANSTALALALAGGSFTLSRFERHRFVAAMLGGFAGAIGLFALLGYLAGIDTLYRSVSVNSLRCRPPLACSASPGGSSCGSERCPRSASPGRCGTCWSCSDARSLRRSCCLAHMLTPRYRWAGIEARGRKRRRHGVASLVRLAAQQVRPPASEPDHAHQVLPLQ